MEEISNTTVWLLYAIMFLLFIGYLYLIKDCLYLLKDDIKTLFKKKKKTKRCDNEVR
jgi:hypothetical protein